MTVTNSTPAENIAFIRDEFQKYVDFWRWVFAYRPVAKNLTTTGADASCLLTWEGAEAVSFTEAVIARHGDWETFIRRTPFFSSYGKGHQDQTLIAGRLVVIDEPYADSHRELLESLLHGQERRVLVLPVSTSALSYVSHRWNLYRKQVGAAYEPVINEAIEKIDSLKTFFIEEFVRREPGRSLGGIVIAGPRHQDYIDRLIDAAVDVLNAEMYPSTEGTTADMAKAMPRLKIALEPFVRIVEKSSKSE